jgi:hypothetical protein
MTARFGSVRSQVGLWLLLAAATGCSVADNLSSDEILEEVDAIVRVEGAGNDRRIRYAERAEVSAWYMRFWLLAPIRGALGFVFGRRGEDELEQPAAHVRVLLRELPDETGGDLLTCAGTAARLSWLLEFEPNAQTKVIALDGLARMAQQLRLELFVPPLETLGTALDQQRLLMAQAGVQTGRPLARPATGFGELQQRPYREALGILTEAPLAEPAARTLVVQQLIELYATESDRELRQVAATALRAGLVHLIQGCLLRAVQGRAPEYAELRLCAMEQVRRLGGPATVPLLLATMIASPAERAAGAPLFDDDALVQLRLIHYCGQLGGDAGDAVVRLPGRQDWQTMSPRFFLATTILNEQAYYSKLRTPALVALTWSLGQPRLDPDPDWVRRWREGRGQ